MMKKVYQFIVKYQDGIITSCADSLEDAMKNAEMSLKDEKKQHSINLIGIFDAEEFSKSLKLSTILVEPAKVDSLEAMAEMLKSNGYSVIKN